ncbi:MAG: hypothetical protein AAFV31_14775 [Pseudomonadota bacterium]
MAQTTGTTTTCATTAGAATQRASSTSTTAPGATTTGTTAASTATACTTTHYGHLMSPLQLMGKLQSPVWILSNGTPGLHAVFTEHTPQLISLPLCDPLSRVETKELYINGATRLEWTHGWNSA